MVDQSFSPSNLSKLLTLSDIIRFGLRKEEIETSVESASVKVNEDAFLYDDFLEKEVGDETIFKIKGFTDHIVLKKINYDLCKLYKSKQANRHLIIRQVVVLLQETTPMTIIRLDVKNFYRTINREKILKKIIDDPLLSFKGKRLIRKLFDSEQIAATTGLPRGINISAILSEIYMREFDSSMVQLPGVYYYARYVDDILIFCFDNHKAIRDSATKLLFELTGLKINENKLSIITRGKCKCIKTCKCKGDAVRFEYLGYSFSFSDVAAEEGLIVSLAAKKIKKIKERIIRSFLDYMQNEDFDLLKKRIIFLTGNNPIKTRKSGELYSGIFFNYPHLINNECLINLNSFLRKTITARDNAFGRKLRPLLCRRQRRELYQYCFISGFRDIRKNHLGTKESKQIRKCWIYG
jgi:hypothetical protein